MMTHMCVDASVRQAADLGYKVTLLANACATREQSFGGETVPARQVHAAFLAALNGFYAKVINAHELQVHHGRAEGPRRAGDAEPAEAAECAQPRADAGARRRRCTAFDADDGIGAIVITGNEKAFAAGADIGAMKDYGYMDAYKADYITRDWEHIRSVQQARDRRGGGLRARRRLRARA